MNVEVPEFLLEMSKQMNDQPNRCTAHPFWQVRCKRCLVTDSGYNESHWEIIDSEDGTTLYHSEVSANFSELFDHIFNYKQEWLINWAEYNCDMSIKLVDGEIDDDCYDVLLDRFNDEFDPDRMDLPDEVVKLHMQEIEEVVSTHLTQSDAEWFIKRKQHDYPRLYTYVESAYWSPQLKQLQDWIKELEK